MGKYESIDDIAKEYALTNEQLMNYLILNDIVSLNNQDKIDLSNQDIKKALSKINENKKFNEHINLTSLKSIEIEGLFGKYNYLIDFKDDISIWVSENGAGKTTILNIIVALLTGDKDKLMDIDFKRVTVNISGESYEIDREQYLQASNRNNINYSNKVDNFLDVVSMYVPRHVYLKLRRDFQRNQNIDLNLIEDFFYRYSKNDVDLISRKKFMYALHELRELQYIDLSRTMSKIETALEEDILFYPTYRRVEVGLDKVFSNRRNEFDRHYLFSKYMGFGMDDVKTRINNILDVMKKDANKAYIEMNANIISELLKNNEYKYLNMENQIDLHKVNVVIKRIGEERIENIDDLKSLINNSTPVNSGSNIEFLLYYLQKLVKIYDKQTRLDSKLRKFSDVCTKYLSGKKIIYDESLLTINVHDCDEKIIDFEDLSSGEKQVISIFSKVYLDLVTPCVFIIDEPEISLSIEWQKEFLKDIFESEKIGLMIAATHSPFIFKNEYRKFVSELGRYKEK